MYFKDRAEAGKKLAELLSDFRGEHTVIYALPRGGVVVGSEIAKALHAPFDLIITRKIGHPNSSEYAIGAVAENGHSILNREETADIDPKWLKNEINKQQAEAKRRRLIYLAGKKPIPAKGKIAILVDDGIATGLTIMAAVQELREHYSPQKIIVAVPVGPTAIAKQLESMEVQFVALEIPEQFMGSIGYYYQDFSQVTDQEVVRLMKGASHDDRFRFSAV